MDSEARHLWNVEAKHLDRLDERRARDLVVECFLVAQRETFVRAKAALGMTPDDASLRRSVKGAVRLAFAKTGGDFDAPTRESLIAAIEELASTAASRGTPADIIAHHRSEIERVLSRLG